MFGWKKKKPTAAYDDSLKTEPAELALTVLATTHWNEAPWHKKLNSAQFSDETSFINPRMAGVIARGNLNRGMLQTLGIMRPDTGYLNTDTESVVVSTRQNIERLASLYRMIADEPELLAKAARFMDVGNPSTSDRKKLKLAAAQLREEADNLDHISKYARQPDGPAHETEPSWDMPEQLRARYEQANTSPQQVNDTPETPARSSAIQPRTPIQPRSIHPDGITNTDFDIQLG